ncbi:hypothetical protein ABB29_07295 [Pseudoxanthomonas dokdonensis]|uniref:TonB-dependent receptor n=2 Tax=Pseudoxanthomonas dokdonensis TaxID=344882 RepID=A0A0R0CKX8_9GAMM|nr:hypothetical protein ABB29_07295 [Pseudoxanthomonas dokdonensis]
MLGGCVLASGAGAAWAQDVQGQDAQNEAILLDTVTVTAQGREQELKDVPIAVNVVSEGFIADTAATDIGDLDMFVPGLRVEDGSPTQPRYAIRGISAGDFGIGTDPPVGVYVDGVYSARTGGAMLAFNDVERIEVLKGPQGTLFGRNSAAGAVSIITNKPSSVFEGDATVRLGNDGRRYVYGLLNAPISDSHALRISAMSNQSDGWLRDAGTGEDLAGDDNWAARMAWRSWIGEDTTLDFTWDHEEISQLARPAIGLVALDSYPATAPYPADPANYLNPIDAPVFNDVIGNRESRRFDAATVQVNHAFSWGNLLSTTAWRDFDTVNREDEDGTNRPNLYFDTANIESNRSYYQEFKFNGVAGAFDWVAGASWFKEDAQQTSATNLLTDSLGTAMQNLPDFGGLNVFAAIDQVLAMQGIPFYLQGHTWNESMHNRSQAEALAAFGDVIWHATDRLNLTFGLRYTHDAKEFQWLNGPRVAPDLDQNVAVLDSLGVFAALQQMGYPVSAEMFQQDFVFNVGPLEGVTFKRKDSWQDLSPRLVIDYALNDNTMVFGSVAKGYKAGGYNALEINSYFDNEEVWNSELGLKMALPDYKLAFNTSAYYMIYKDRQSITLDLNSQGSGVPRYLVSTDDTQAWGVDADLHWQPLQGLDLMLGMAYIDATYKNGESNGRDLSGDATGEPYLSATASGSYTWLLDRHGSLRMSLMHGYRGQTRCNADSSTQGTCQVSPVFRTGEAQNRTDMRLQWTSVDGQWGVGVYANNLFDNQYIGVNNLTTSVLGTPFASVSEPRQYGLELNYSF